MAWSKRTLGRSATQPGAGVEPPQQAEHLGWIVEIAVAIGLFDLCGMVPMRLWPVVASEASRVLDVELMSGMADHMGRNRGGVRKEGAQKPDRAELNGKSQTVVVAAVSRDHLTVSVVQMEIASELTGRRMIGIAPIAAVLVLTQELDRHTVPCRGVKRAFLANGYAERKGSGLLHP